jgi:hypothetical protein
MAYRRYNHRPVDYDYSALWAGVITGALFVALILAGVLR